MEPSKLTPAEVRGIATYTRIGLPDEKLPQMTDELNSIVDSLAPITKFDLEDVKPTFHPIGGLTNVMREDTCVPSLSNEVALQNSSSTEDGAFRIPTILGGEDQA